MKAINMMLPSRPVRLYCSTVAHYALAAEELANYETEWISKVPLGDAMEEHIPDVKELLCLTLTTHALGFGLAQMQKQDALMFDVQHALFPFGECPTNISALGAFVRALYDTPNAFPLQKLWDAMRENILEKVIKGKAEYNLAGTKMAPDALDFPATSVERLGALFDIAAQYCVTHDVDPKKLVPHTDAFFRYYDRLFHEMARP